MNIWPKPHCPKCGRRDAAPDLTEHYRANWNAQGQEGECPDCKAPWVWLDSWAGWECVWPTPAKLCAQCGKGHYRRTARPGRTEEYNGIEVEIPADVALLECDACHEILMSPKDMEVLSHIFEATTARAVKQILPLAPLTVEEIIAERQHLQDRRAKVKQQLDTIDRNLQYLKNSCPGHTYPPNGDKCTICGYVTW